MSESQINWIAALRHSLIGSSAERRREERRYLKFPIEVRASSGATSTGLSRDISRSSMGAVVSTPLKIGQEVWVSYEHPAAGGESARTVTRHAMVRQRLGFRYGFDFDQPMDV